MTGSFDISKRLLWGGLVALLLTAVAHANTLTKVRAAESDDDAQLIFSLTHWPSYQVIPALEQQRVMIVFVDTATKFDASKLRFTGAVIQGLEIHGPAQADVSQHSLGIEVLLHTSDVTVSHQALTKPPGLLVHLRRTASSPQTDDIGPRRRPTQPAAAPELTQASPLTASPNAALRARSESEPATAVAPYQGAAERTGAPEASTETAETPPSAVEESPTRLATSAQVAPRPITPPPPALPATEEARNIQGSGSAAEALALLELYFQHPSAFAANPALLWSVAAAYVDLGFYEQGDALYRQIAEHADHSALRAAAMVKRGKIAMLRGELASAEQLLREFIRTSRHGSLLAEAYEALGDTLMAREQFREAAEMYDVTLSYTPEAHKPPQVLYKLGRAERQAGNWPQAAAAFRQAVDQWRISSLARDSSSGGGFPPAFEEDLLRQLGDSLYKTQRYGEAVAAYRRVLEQAPTAWHTAWTLYHLGKSYEALGRYDDASQVYQELAHQADALWSELAQQALTALRWRER
jgi:TolA-binding protein